MHRLLPNNTTTNHLNISKLIFAIFIFPFFGLFINILFNKNILLFLRAEYLQISYLLLIILFKFKYLNVSQNLLKLIKYLYLYIFVILSIELYYIFIQNKGIDDLSDIRAIFYSPLYSSILIFILSSFYVSLLNKYEKIIFFRFIINISLIFSLIFNLCLILLITDVFEAPQSSNYLNSNSFSYFFLFILFIFYYFNSYFKMNRSLKYIHVIFLILNIFFIFSIGCILILIFFIFLNFLNKTYLLKLTYIFIITFLAFIVLLNIIQFFVVDINYILYLNEFILNNFKFNETILSISSRLFTFYVGFSNLFNSPNIFLFGIGEKSTLSINYFGSSIHTFHIKFILSVGLIGYLALLLIIHKFYEFNFKTFDHLNIMFMMLIFLILLFENSIPFYFFIIFLLPKLSASNKEIFKYK